MSNLQVLGLVLTPGYSQVFGDSLRRQDNAISWNKTGGVSKLAEQRAARKAAAAAQASSSPEP